MPISIEEFREPKFITPKPKLPFGENSKDKFLDFTTRPRNYRGRDNVPGFKQEGYNPNSGIAVPRDVNLNSDDLTLPSR